jgi:hypothetical protein
MRAVDQDGYFRDEKAFENQFSPKRINMLPQNQVEGFMKIHLK